MTYPPSGPGDQPPYGPYGNYRPPQQPARQPQQPQQPPDNAGQQKSGKGKWVAGLGVAASIATILTLFITLNQQPNPPDSGGGGTTTTTVDNGYPVNVQTNFLNSCETNGSVQGCQCSLSWFESNVPLTRFEQDETMLEQGSEPADLVNAARACGG